MTFTANPAWPEVVLAAIAFADGLLCLKPAQFIAKCFRDVGWLQKW